MTNDGLLLGLLAGAILCEPVHTFGLHKVVEFNVLIIFILNRKYSFMKIHNSAKLALIGAAVLASVNSAHASTNITLADLFKPGASIILGDKEFYNFGDWAIAYSGGAIPITPQDITVHPYTVGNSEFLNFQSVWFAPANSLLDTQFSYDVKTLSGAPLIDGASVSIPYAAALGIAAVTVTDTITDGPNSGLLVFTTASTSQLSNSAFFTTQYSHIHVAKDIGLHATDGAASLSAVVQGVSQVPVPAAVYLFGSALLSLGIFGRRKSVDVA